MEQDQVSLNSALTQAADGDPEWVEGLLAAGADPNGMPIIMAIQCDETDIVRMMIAAGVDVNQDFADTTPLIRAVGGMKFEIVQVLIDAGADVNKKSKDGFTPLLAAKKRGMFYTTEPERQEMIKLLQESGAKE